MESNCGKSGLGAGHFTNFQRLTRTKTGISFHRKMVLTQRNFPSGNIYSIFPHRKMSPDKYIRHHRCQMESESQKFLFDTPVRNFVYFLISLLGGARCHGIDTLNPQKMPAECQKLDSDLVILLPLACLDNITFQRRFYGLSWEATKIQNAPLICWFSLAISAFNIESVH